ncbi:MAG: polysaccharide lyase [bacterium]
MNKLEELYDGFEEKTLSNIWDQTKIEPGAVEIQSDIVRKGKSAIKITIHKGDRIQPGYGIVKTSERDELVERKELGPKEGKSYSYSFSLYIPKDFPIVPTRLVLAQWKQSDENNTALVINPLLALRYQNGELYITLQTTEKSIRLFQTKEEIRGQWIDYVFHMKFTRIESGFVKVWMNGKEIINYTGITAYSEKYNYLKLGYFYFKMGLYRDQMDEPMTIYLDEYRKNQLSVGQTKVRV